MKGEPMSKQEPVSGIVGFFDILGYQSFLEVNEPEVAALTVLNMLSEIDKVVMKYLIEKLPDALTDKNIIDRFKWLVFSDTILFTAGTSEPEDAVTSMKRWVFFLIASDILQWHMFQFGLPLRGAITSGKFIIIGNCFAGRPIIEGYELSQNLDLAATILSHAANLELSQTLQSVEKIVDDKLKWTKETTKSIRRFIKSAAVEYLVPFKSREERYMTLGLGAAPIFTGQMPAEDVSQMVFEAFWKHNKGITHDAARKARNTEQYLRFLRYRNQRLLHDPQK
jgi:hypothetical protein